MNLRKPGSQEAGAKVGFRRSYFVLRPSYFVLCTLYSVPRPSYFLESQRRRSKQFDAKLFIARRRKQWRPTAMPILNSIKRRLAMVGAVTSEARQRGE